MTGSGNARHGVQGRRLTCGFTLLEVLIVLAVLAALAALSWPALRGQLETARLRDAAKQLRDELLRTRHLAVETGVPHQVRYRFGTRRFEVLPAPFNEPAAWRTVASTGHAGTPRNLERNRMAETGGRIEPDPAARHDLPEGVVFADPVELPSDRGAGPNVDASSAGTIDQRPPGAGDTGAFVDASQTLSVVFFPNGRTNNARLRVVNPRGDSIDVRLRGLTGSATLGPVERREVKR